MNAYPTQRSEALFDAFDSAFRFFGGGTPKFEPDNAKTLVKKILRGHDRIEQDLFVAFRTHYLFEAHFCNVESGNEKGGVEGIIKFAQRNFFTPVPQVESYDALNALLLSRCIAQSGRRIAYRSETIGEAFERERGALRALPAFAFDCCRRIETGANSLSQVAFETNRYSVPVRYAFEPVVLKAYVDRVAIFCKDQKIAEHPRLYGRGQEALDPLHYLPLLEKKPGALDHGKPFQNWVLPEVFRRFRKTTTPRAYIRILQEILNVGVDAVAAALQQAVAEKLTTVDQVLRLLQGSQPIEKLDLGSRPELAGVVIPNTNLKAYNQLLSM